LFPRRLGQLPHAVVEGQEQLVDLCAENAIAFLPFFMLAIPGPNNPASPAVTSIAKARGVSEAQVALAWLLARSPTILPIPGTSSVSHLDENWAARTIELSKDEIAAISAARALRLFIAVFECGISFAISDVAPLGLI